MFFLSLRRLRLNKKGYVPRSKQLVNLESNVDLSYSKDVTVIYVIIASFSIDKKKGRIHILREIPKLNLVRISLKKLHFLKGTY